MFKEYLKGIDGISFYPILSLVVFFLVFIGVSWWIIKSDKHRLYEISEIPLKDSANETGENN